MISAVAPGAHITVEDLEQRLRDLGCTKFDGTETKTTCIWRAPNGHAFSAPNAAFMYMVPTDLVPELLRRIERLKKLPRPPGAVN